MLVVANCFFNQPLCSGYTTNSLSRDEPFCRLALEINIKASISMLCRYINKKKNKNQAFHHHLKLQTILALILKNMQAMAKPE